MGDGACCHYCRKYKCKCESTEAANDQRLQIRTHVAALVLLATRQHYYCEDSWYSCPKAEGGCLNEAWGSDCNCGADEHNKRVDEHSQQLAELGI